MVERQRHGHENSINHPANKEIRTNYIKSFLMRVPLEAQDILYQYSVDSDETVRTVEQFRRHIAQTYNAPDRKLIFGALDLAIVAHERNGIVQNRTRKDKVTPYIKHPVEIAGALAGMDRSILLPISEHEDATVVLPVRQHPYKAEVVVAGLLHDVLEDVYLPIAIDGDSNIKTNIGRKQGDIHWPELIGAHLKFAGATEKQVRAVNVMVQAVTKYLHHDFAASVREGIIDSDLFPTFINAVQRRGANKSSVVVEREVVRTLSDLHRMFAVCFPKWHDGGTQITNESLELFFGALVIKLHDIENNLETGVRSDKIIRAHLLAHFARFFGFPVASRLGVHLIVNNEYDITRVGEGVNADAIKMVMKYCDEEKDPTLRPELKTGPLTIRPEATQIPITTYAEQQEHDGTHKHSPVLQYKCTVGDEVFGYLGQAGERSVSITDQKGFDLKRINTSIQELIREYGRQVEYYRIERIDGESIGVVRFQDAQPNAHSVLAQGSAIGGKKVPEHRLLKRFDGTSYSTMDILAKMSPLRLG